MARKIKTDEFDYEEQGFSTDYLIQQTFTTADPYKGIYMSKKAKILIFILLLFFVMIFAGIFIAWNTMVGSSELILKQPVITYELGQEVRLDKDLFLDRTAISAWVYDSITTESELITDDENYMYDEYKNSVTSKGKSYLMTGDYKVTFRLQDQEQTVMMHVEDTTAPKIQGMTSITIEKDARGVNLEDYISVSDYNNTEVETEGEWTLSKTGGYDIQLIATDDAGNRAEKKIKINVVSKKDAQTKGDDLLSTTLEDKTPVSYDTEKLIVEGKCKTIKNPTGKDGGKIAKGQFSNEEDQKKYEDELAKKEAEKKAKEEKERAEREAQLQAQQQQQQSTYTQPQVNSGGNNSSNSSNNSSSSSNNSSSSSSNSSSNSNSSASSGGCDLSTMGLNSMTDSQGNTYYNAYPTQMEAMNALPGAMDKCSSGTMGIESAIIGGHFPDGTNVYFRIVKY